MRAVASAAILVAPALGSGGAGAAESAPPDPFIARGACPFECCTFQEWTVERDTQLYDRPAGKRIPVHLKKGERVAGITGEVHVRPLKARVLRDRPPFKRGDTFYVLDHLELEVFRLWYRGRILEDAPDFLADPGCASSDEGCWSKGQGRRHETWWVQVRTRAGAEGWSGETDHFGNMDACDPVIEPGEAEPGGGKTGPSPAEQR